MQATRIAPLTSNPVAPRQTKISDVLFEASGYINNFLAGEVFEKCFADISGPLNKIVLLLDATGNALKSCPPSPSTAADIGKHAAAERAFWEALAALKIQPVLDALTALQKAE